MSFQKINRVRESYFGSARDGLALCGYVVHIPNRPDQLELMRATQVRLARENIARCREFVGNEIARYMK